MISKRLYWYMLISFAIIVFVFLLLPLIIVVPVSFSNVSWIQFPPPGFSLRWYDAFFAEASWRISIITSLKIAIFTVLLSVVLGTLAALALSRLRSSGSTFLSALFISPMIVPAIAFAVSIFSFFAPLRLIGHTGAIAIAHTVIALPFVFINVSASLQAFDTRLEQAALNLGASPWKAFWFVKLPLLRPGLLAGSGIAFIQSFDELIVTLFLVSPTAKTLPIQMWDGVTQEVTPVIAVASTLLLIIYLIVIVLIALFNQRRNILNRLDE